MKNIAIKLSIILLIIITITLSIINIDNTKATPKTLVQTVIDLSQGDTYTEGNGNGVYYTNSHEYRYVGGEVNNYVKFNDDMYRIIGVFDSNTHGIANTWLVKLISANKLISAAWGVRNTSASSYATYENYSNDWTGNTTGVPASANILLNTYYLNPTSTSNYGECINLTYGSNNDLYKSKNCSNIKGYGIQTTNLRNYIEDGITWYLKGLTGNGNTKQAFYTCERSDSTTVTNCYAGGTSSGGYYDTKIKDSNLKIGLMYASDYLYASGYIASADTSTLASSSKYMNSNWLYNGLEWTITPIGNNATSAFYVDSAGRVYNGHAYFGRGLRPTFYLKSTIKIKSGTGTFANPYIIG
ncbi:MAG: hypothetical protein IJH34_05305 [Romboutsia sp.]|nr:hypothetical protein [Romboutsia sp.]